MVTYTKVVKLPYPGPISQTEVDQNAAAIKQAAKEYEQKYNCTHRETQPSTWSTVLLTFQKNQ